MSADRVSRAEWAECHSKGGTDEGSLAGESAGKGGKTVGVAGALRRTALKGSRTLLQSRGGWHWFPQAAGGVVQQSSKLQTQLIPSS
jgi:hypothetical protein